MNVCLHAWLGDNSGSSCVRLELRSLPSPGVTRLKRYCRPLRLPRAPGLSLTGIRLIIPDRGGHNADMRPKRIPIILKHSLHA